MESQGTFLFKKLLVIFKSHNNELIDPIFLERPGILCQLGKQNFSSLFGSGIYIVLIYKLINNISLEIR